MNRQQLEPLWTPITIRDFVVESNRIEGILREPLDAEIKAHIEFISLDTVRVPDLLRFVQAVASAPLRDREGMDVRVGAHFPPAGGPAIERGLRALLVTANTGEASAYEVHQGYERLHPFMDGNGRSGRVLWAWQKWHVEARDPFHLPFLHRWYYDSLDAGRES